MSKPRATGNPRLNAVTAIGGVLDRGQNLAEIDALNTTTQQGGDRRDLAFSRHLAYGVLRWLGALEWIAGQLLKKPMKEKDSDIYRLVLIGLYQLWKEESAEHAAIYETAECARVLRKNWAVGLVNAVLRRFQREREELLRGLGEQVDRFAHPQWLYEILKNDWPKDWESIVNANNRQPGLWLRINRSRSDISAVEGMIKAAGLTSKRHSFAPDAIEVSPAKPVEQLPGYTEGLWSVQDPAAQLAASWLDLQPGQRVLDACAAPGGKTCHIRETVPDATVVALDRSETRLKRLIENADRLGLADENFLSTVAADALETGDWWDGEMFDRILLDAPCTATGVIRRHPEIKWLRTPGQVSEAVELQSALLRHLWPLLKPGGILVYATCSVLEDENSRQVSQFISDSDDTDPEVPEVAYGRVSGHGVQILPGESDMDGFFYARIRKKN